MAHKFSPVVVETLTGHRTLTQAETDAATILSFDPDGAKNLILPAEADNAGQVLFIHNSASGAEVITIQDDTPATVATPGQNESAAVWCDGVSWFGLVGASS